MPLPFSSCLPSFSLVRVDLDQCIKGLAETQGQVVTLYGLRGAAGQRKKQH